MHQAFAHAALVIMSLSGQVYSNQPLQYQVERKVCGQEARIKSDTTGEIGKSRIVCSR